MPEIRRCGRPTKSGKPCQTQLHGSVVSCRSHAADGDDELARWYGIGLEEGMRRGQQMAEWSAEYRKDRVEQLESKVAELTKKLEDALRYYDFDGDQVVEIDGRYAYRWGGSPPLEVGDRVVLPPNWFTTTVRGKGPFEGTVTGLGTTYRGELARVVRRAPGQPPS
ncbi:hypothetical protein ACQPZF_26020 [Actinosynnema sp. CS-041913]|uniref:hypothetical protein n=1 Tax=Actinosynnema sp. CS-041913 TaxID=3239917 RepID=UPI003D94B9F3